ncbi:hypothetical protein ACQRBN_11530 [Bariatricus sp. SGI.154]|uniref:hypothetical protein n=1 Tax=Bariatricus sp. SGI.154 TaxID=3420549 RepID=UPI003D0597AC
MAYYDPTLVIPGEPFPGIVPSGGGVSEPFSLRGGYTYIPLSDGRTAVVDENGIVLEVGYIED